MSSRPTSAHTLKFQDCPASHRPRLMRTGQVYLTLCPLTPSITLYLTASTLSGCRLKAWSHASTEASLSCRCHRVLHSPNQRAVLIRVAAVSMKVASAYSRSAFVQSCFPSASSACRLRLPLLLKREEEKVFHACHLGASLQPAMCSADTYGNGTGHASS